VERRKRFVYKTKQKGATKMRQGIERLLAKPKRKWFLFPLLILLIASIALVGCSSSTSTSSVTLTGTGATFPQPLYTTWCAVYYTLTGVKINYQGIGSGGGINAITAGTVDFGASDGIMTPDQQSAAEEAHGPILHIPMTMGAVAIIYNLAGVDTGQLKLTGDVLADICLKKITTWSDPSITALNPGLQLPDAAIAVVHRSDGSGTNYLSQVSADWSTQVGYGTSVNWPGDIGAPQNAGVAGAVKQQSNSIGYVELAYALQNNIPYAQLENSSGNYIAPSLASTSEAASGVTLPDDMKVMMTNSANPDAYPIVGFTWILVYVNQTDKAKGEALAKFLLWAIHDGQQYCEGISYARLPDTAVTKAENEILSIEYQGQPLLQR
jgi:phosphate transport system substrate-binding protein